jgi:hypothetical protein
MKYTHGQDVLTSEAVAVKLEVRADTFLTLAINDVIGALAILRRDAVDVLGEADDLAAVVAVELQRPLCA